MTPLRAFALTAGMILLSLPAAAQGGEYSDPSGLSFTYPNDWVVTTETVRRSASQTAHHSPGSWQPEYSQVAANLKFAIARPLQNGFAENMSVVVAPAEIPVIADLAPRVGTAVENQLRRTYPNAKLVRAEVRKFNAYSAIVIETQSVIDGKRVSMLQAYIPGGGKTNIVTFGCLTDFYASRLPIYNTILASIKTPAPTSQTSTMADSISRWLSPSDSRQSAASPAAGTASGRSSFSMSRFDPRRMILYAFVGCCVALLAGLIKRTLSA